FGMKNPLQGLGIDRHRNGSAFSAINDPRYHSTVTQPPRGVFAEIFATLRIDCNLCHEYLLIKSQINKLLTDVSSWIDWTALASSFPTLRTRIFLHFRASLCRGIVFVTTISSSPAFKIRSTAGPERTGCVPQAYTLVAP